MSVRGPLGATPQSGAFELRTSSLQARGAVPGAPIGLLGLFGVLATGLVISLAAAGTNTLLPESVRPVPNWLAGPFGSTRLDLGIPALIVVLTAMFVSYAVAVHAADRLSAPVVLMTIAALHALVLLAPPLISTDVFSYQAYARMGALYGANPYVNGPHAIALDMVFPFVGAKWSYIPSAYGPVFTAMSYLFAPLSIAASVLAYKSLAAFASLATVALVWNAARLRGVDPVKAAALVGLNPLVVIYGVGGGHNDLLMLVAMTAGVYLLLRQRGRAGGALLVLATGIKLTAGLVLPFAFAGAPGRPARTRRRELAIGAGLTAVLLAALTLALFGSGSLNLLATLNKTQNEGDWHSIPGFITSRFGLGNGTIVGIPGLLLGVGFVAVLCWLVRKVGRGELDWIDGAGWATVAILVTATALLPWYVAWLLPLVALSGDRRLWRSAIVLSGLVQGIQMLGYIPHGSALLGV
jgi:Glycosyltransferase family 87